MSTTHDKALSRALSTGYLRYCSCVKPGFHPIATIHVDCEQFLFFFKYWGVRARGHLRVLRVLLDGLRKQRGCSWSTIAGKKTFNDVAVIRKLLSSVRSSLRASSPLIQASDASLESRLQSSQRQRSLRYNEFDQNYGLAMGLL